MTVISSREFAANQDMYFNLAVKENICIDNGEKMFQLLYNRVSDTSGYDEILEPDEDFYKAISADEFKKRALEAVEMVHNKYVKK